MVGQIQGKKGKMIEEVFDVRLLPLKKGRVTPKQKVGVRRWYLKRKDAVAWKKKKRMSKATKKARQRNRGK